MPNAPSLDVTAVIAGAANRRHEAFFDADALNAWWQVARSVTTPRTLGPYAVEWTPTDFRDEVLDAWAAYFEGPSSSQPRRGFCVADAFWLPPMAIRSADGAARHTAGRGSRNRRACESRKPASKKARAGADTTK